MVAIGSRRMTELFEKGKAGNELTSTEIEEILKHNNMLQQIADDVRKKIRKVYMDEIEKS